MLKKDRHYFVRKPRPSKKALRCRRWRFACFSPGQTEDTAKEDCKTFQTKCFQWKLLLLWVLKMQVAAEPRDMPWSSRWGEPVLLSRHAAPGAPSGAGTGREQDSLGTATSPAHQTPPPGWGRAGLSTRRGERVACSAHRSRSLIPLEPHWAENWAPWEDPFPCAAPEGW